jgi:hypothetical protein
MQRNGNAEGTFHHLIALFCTVSAIATLASPLATIFFNEIKYLETIAKVNFSKNTFKIKYLARLVKVTREGFLRATTLHYRM